MKPCEYYERLISDNLESALGEREKLELSEHLRQCTSCREFAADLERQQSLLHSLPAIEATRSLDIPAPRSHPGILSRIWNTRIAVPVPVAAAAILVLLSVAVFSLLSQKDPASIEQPLAAGQVDYVQVETISPSTAVRTSSHETE